MSSINFHKATSYARCNKLYIYIYAFWFLVMVFVSLGLDKMQAKLIQQ